MKKALLMIFLSVATTSVFSQAKNFEGFFVEGGFAVGSTTVRNTEVVYDFNNSPPTSTTTDKSLGKSFAESRVSFGYMKALNNNFLLGVSFGSMLGSTSLPGESNNVSSETGKLKNNYQLALIPAYALTDNFAIRGKVSYNKANYESNKYFPNGGFPVNRLNTAKLNGIGLGVGAQYFFTKKLYGAIDVERIAMSSKYLKMVEDTQPPTTVTDVTVEVKPTQTMGLISIGYKF